MKINPIYTGWFVEDKKALEEKYPSRLPNKYYDHVTIAWKPKDVETDDLGVVANLAILSRLTTDKVDVLLVYADSENMYPHITLATAEGVAPYEANEEILEHTDDITLLRDRVKTKMGAFINGKVIYK